MTLLVTQMKNQDPLNPLDNAQVTSQLAQLSTVQGIDKMNTTLQSLISNVQSSQTLQATSMIGRNVLTAGNTMALKNNNATFGVQLDNAVDSLSVTIRDANGKAVHTMDIGAHDAGVFALNWDGKKDDGSAGVDGQYKFELSAKLTGNPATATALTSGTVSTVANGASGTQLNVSGVGARALSDIVQIM